jgi:group I intron endonuclease
MKAIIYKIENIRTSDCYIGSTVNYSRRSKRHFEDLKRKIHHSLILQRAWDKYGEQLFRIFKLETFDYSTKEEILNKEQEYLDLVKPKYNVCRIAGSQLGTKRSKEFREKCSERMKGKEPWNKGEKLPKQSEETKAKRIKSLIGRSVSEETKSKIKAKLSKPILQYDAENNFIREWESAKKASLELGFSYTALIKYLNGKSNINTFKNWIWKRK